MLKPLATNKFHTHFSVCLQCKPCGGDCSFLDNNVTFIRNRKTNRMSLLVFDTSMAACNGQCGYDCGTKFKLTEILKDNRQLSFVSL